MRTETNIGASTRVRGTGIPATALFLCLTIAACGPRKAPEEKRYDLKGKVVNVDKRGSAVTIAHETIPGYMEAMTMPFHVNDTWVFDVMAAGDKVQATLVVSGSRSWIENPVVVRGNAGPSNLGDPNARLGPELGEEIPDFSLVNQEGNRIGIHQYRGQALILTFIYTRCPLPDYCPLMNTNFAAIHDALYKNPKSYPESHLLSISIDPDHDTPKVLESYGRTYTSRVGDGGFQRWEFATGTGDEVKKMAAYFGLQYAKDVDQIVHSLQTAIIQPNGKLFKLYRGNEWKPAELLNDLQSLKVD